MRRQAGRLAGLPSGGDQPVDIRWQMSTRADEAPRQTEQTTRRKAAACRFTGFWQATMDGAHFRGSLVWAAEAERT